MSSKIKALAICLLITSCSAPRVVQDYQRDSLIVHIKDSIILRDSVILVPVPAGSSSAVLPQTDTSHLETSVAVSVAFVADGRLHHTLTNKDALLPVSITIPMKVHSEQREKAMIWKQVETIEVEKELSRWQNFIQMLGYGVLIACAIWLARKVAKFVI